MPLNTDEDLIKFLKGPKVPNVRPGSARIVEDTILLRAPASVGGGGFVGGSGAPSEPTCDPTNPNVENVDAFSTISLELHVFGQSAGSCGVQDVDGTLNRTLTREYRGLGLTGVKPVGDHFQLWRDSHGFEHFELPDTIDCFNCFGGWTSCTAAFQVVGSLADLGAYNCGTIGGSYSPASGGGVVGAQVTWFNATGVDGWSTGNELQFYYYNSQLGCEEGPPFFGGCGSFGSIWSDYGGTNDFEGGKDLLSIPGTYNYIKSLTTGGTGLVYDFTATFS